MLAATFLALTFAFVEKTRADNAAVSGANPSFVPTPLTVHSADSSPVIAVVTTGAGRQGRLNASAATRWGGLLAEDLGADVITVGSGYLTAGADANLPSTLGRIPNDADVVVFVGGPPTDSRLSTLSAATRAFSAGAQQVPAAELVAVGPFGSRATSREREALRTAALVDEVTWVDPVAAGWFAAVPTDDEALTAAQDRIVADRLRPILQELIAQRAKSE